jgi:hypothetical protein
MSKKFRILCLDGGGIHPESTKEENIIDKIYLNRKNIYLQNENKNG